MKKSLIALATVSVFALGLSGPVVADEGAFKSAGCAKCHDPEKKKKGAPSIKDMQGKFKGDKGKIDSLAAVIVKGKDHPEVDAKEPDVKKALGFAVGAK
jgi:cytochrome c551/c552